MERLTSEHWRNLDPWECCGQDGHCTRGCHEEGGCNNGCIVPDLYVRLATYEDLFKTGELVQLPCAIGADVYFVPSECNFKLNILSDHEEQNKIYHQKVVRVVFTGKGWYLESNENLDQGLDYILVDSSYKETWFLTESEAEERLEHLKKISKPLQPEFLHNRSDTVSVWRCKCGNVFQTTHEPGVLDGTDVRYCCKCGTEFNWKENSDENE